MTQSLRFAPFAVLGVMASMLSATSLANDAPHGYPESKLIVFDAPGAAKTTSTICGTACGTQALAMNDEGTIVGYYTDDQVVPHAFIRHVGGSFTTFQAPNAGTGAYLNEGTVAFTINNFGVVGGQYEDANEVYHGFLRYPDNHYEIVDAPQAGTIANTGTLVFSNNDEGESAGVYIDANGVEYSFFRSRAGVITPILPDKTAVFVGVCEETCLNREGTSVGSYGTSDYVYRGFLRTRDGKITTFAAPGAGTTPGSGTLVASISVLGEITGYIVDNNGLAHGFIRHCDGTFDKDFEIPEAASSPRTGTAPFSIDAFGITTGEYIDSSSVLHGFERTPWGLVALIDAPKTAAGTGPGQGTRPSVNNDLGEVAGWTIDANGLQHGFLWIP